MRYYEQAVETLNKQETKIIHMHIHTCIYTYIGLPDGSAGKESTWNAGDLSLIPGLGRSPGEGNGCLLQYFSILGLKNSMDCVVHGVAASETTE